MATNYPPLAEVRQSLRGEWYRCPIEGAKFRELSKRSNLQGWFQAGRHLALFAPHELGHGTVFRTKWLNKLFMYLFSLLSWWDPFDYASRSVLLECLSRNSPFIRFI